MFFFIVGPPVVSPFLYTTHAEQQYDELTQLLERVVNMDIPILMGGFNHGPASPGGITWELPFHYGLMNARGLISPYVINDGRCTWCLENPVSSASFPFNLIIDHIYITTDTINRVIRAKVLIQCYI